MGIELHKFPHEINVVWTQTPNLVFLILSKLPILCQTVCTQKSEGQFIIQSIYLTLQNRNICDWLSMGRGHGLDFALPDCSPHGPSAWQQPLSFSQGSCPV